ncbi:hypothetical protein N0V88_003342 [Collariella sp. IMI 366227]|nr:hypothetical protein N0V88_003342 [Collariella sp. IMI 366227]
MHLILTGATGLVGTAVLDAMIRTTDITKISVLSRRPVKFNDERINVILHKDFTSYDQDVLRKLEGEAEIALDELQKLNPSTFRATTVRPGFVDWTNHQDLKPVLPELGWVKTTMGREDESDGATGEVFDGAGDGDVGGAVMEGEGVERLEEG